MRDYYPEERVKALRDLSIALMQEVEPWRYRSPKGFRRGQVVLRNGHAGKKGRGYRKLVDDPRATVNIRRGWDDGLMDVFHPERLWPEQRELIIDETREAFVATLLFEAFGRSMRPFVRNIYVHDSRAVPRGYHVDGYGFKAKSFVYLTHVESLSDGPYCYATKTHRAAGLALVNRAVNKVLGRRLDDFPLAACAKRVPLLGKAGDLIVSVQCGAHRGWPLAAGRQRAVLVEAFETAAQIG